MPECSSCAVPHGLTYRAFTDRFTPFVDALTSPGRLVDLIFGLTAPLPGLEVKLWTVPQANPLAAYVDHLLRQADRHKWKLVLLAEQELAATKELAIRMP